MRYSLDPLNSVFCPGMVFASYQLVKQQHSGRTYEQLEFLSLLCCRVQEAWAAYTFLGR